MNCYVCYCLYRDPRILECGHSFCWRCVKGLVENFNFYCPICRWPIVVGEGWNVRKNYQLAGIVEELREWDRIQRASAGVIQDSETTEESSEESDLERPLIPIERQVLNLSQKLYLLFISLNTFPFVHHT